MKLCSLCKKEKPRTEFYVDVRYSSGLFSRCKVCHRAVGKPVSDQRRAVVKRIVEDAKSVPCADCGDWLPRYCMEFDHRRDKLFNLADHGNRALAKIRAEIKKCDVVCANCHRVRTFRQKVGFLRGRK